MTLTHSPFYIAPFLTSPLLPPLLPFLATERCFRTRVLTTYQSFYLSLSLRSFTPMSILLPSIFRKLAGMTLSPTLTPTVLLQRNTRLSSAAALFTSLALNAAKSSISFGRIKRHPKAWWSAKVKGAVSKDARLLLPLTEVMKIARLTYPLLDAPRQLSPRPRLRHSRRLALLFHPNLTQNCILSSSLYRWLSLLVFLLS